MIAWMENQPMLYFNFCQDQLRLPKNTYPAPKHSSIPQYQSLYSPRAHQCSSWVTFLLIYYLWLVSTTGDWR